MKKRLLSLILAGALALGLAAPALAAPAETPKIVPSGITVQLNGEPLHFTDAAPLNADGRTMLPFRAVFEALGAEVRWADGVVTAVRGDTSLTMTIGSPEVQVVRDGQSTTLTMDVAPFIDPASGRTYVPLRFAAQALGCSVGWDSAGNGTAVLVDSDTLLKQVKQAGSYTLLEKFLAYSDKYNEGIWDCELDMEGSASLLGQVVLPLSGRADATVANAAQMDMDMTMLMDMRPLMEFILAMSANAGATDSAIEPEGEEMLRALAEEGISLSMRGDLAQGLLYMNMDLSALGALEESPFPADAWYRMDMNALLEQADMGMDFQTLMAASKTVDYEALLRSAIQNTNWNDAGAYALLAGTLKELAAQFSDQGFVRDGETYTTHFALEQDGAALTGALTLTVRKDAVVAYDMDITMAVSSSAALLSEPAQTQTTDITLAMHTAMDEKDRMTADVAMGLALNEVPMLTMELTMAGAYRPGTDAPQIQPPAGAVILDYTELMAQAAQE